MEIIIGIVGLVVVVGFVVWRSKKKDKSGGSKGADERRKHLDL